MNTEQTIDEIQNFIDHLVKTAHYVKSHDEGSGYTSTRDMLRQTFEIAFDTYDDGKLDWDTDEEKYGEIFDLVVEKLKKIIA